jgi:CRP-like cAMP-binding protein
MQYINPYIELCLEGSDSVFKGLSQKEKEIIANHHTISIFKKGEYIFKEGDKVRGLICLASGKAKTYKNGVGGREQILQMVNQSECLGYRGLFSENTWSFSAIALGDSTVCLLAKHSLVKILKKNSELSFKVNKVLADELWYSYNRTISLTQKHVRGRLAESMLLLAEIYGYEEDGKTLRAALSRDDIAHLSNMTTSNAIRTLSNFASESIIELKGRRIKIINLPGLEDINESA